MNVYSIPVIFTGTMYVQAEDEVIARHLAELAVRDRRVILSRRHHSGELVTGSADSDVCDCSMILSGDIIVSHEPEPVATLEVGAL